MELRLIRYVRTKKTTTGKLYINDDFAGFVLEDYDRGLTQQMSPAEISSLKVKNKTCIPAGRYEVTITFSNRFQQLMPLLLNVPGFQGIRIHPGNTAEDTAGCLLPGDGRTLDTVIGSRSAYKKILESIQHALQNDERVFINIK